MAYPHNSDTHIGSLKTGLGVASIIMAPVWLGLVAFTMGSLLGGGLWIGHENSLEASRVSQEAFSSIRGGASRTSLAALEARN